MRTPEQIIGQDAYLQLVFEGFTVVSSERISELEAALRIITHRDRFSNGAIVNSYMEDVDLREYAPVLETIHPAK